MQAIDQTIFPLVLGKTKVFYYPRSLTSGNIPLSSFPIPREKYFDLLPTLPLNNCIIFDDSYNTQECYHSNVYWLDKYGLHCQMLFRNLINSCKEWNLYYLFQNWNLMNAVRQVLHKEQVLQNSVFKLILFCLRK